MPSRRFPAFCGNIRFIGNLCGFETVIKPANPEQEAVIKALQRDGAVVVQGPPGTGKTHTIANLIGHLLAEGKTVLVTSHTTKALRVLRDQVAEELRPLCVSVLDRDSDSRQQLEESVKGIIQGLAVSKDQHRRESDTARSVRSRLLARLQELEGQLLKAITDQYDDIVIGGQTLSPAKAARQVHDEASLHDWLPGPIAPSLLCPLSAAEIIELYSTNIALSAGDESDLSEPLPDPDKLPNPAKFATVVSELANLEAAENEHNSEFWQFSGTFTTDELRDLESAISAAVITIRQADRLSLECMDAGRNGGARRDPWDNLLTTIEQLGESIDNAQSLVAQTGPRLNIDWPLAQQVEVCQEILAHLDRRSRITKFQFLINPKWKTFIAGANVGGRHPVTADDFRAIKALLQTIADRDELLRRWKLQVEPISEFATDRLGPRPERTTRQFLGRLRDSLSWHERVWKPIEDRFAKAGLAWDRVLALTAPRPEANGDLLRFADACEQTIGRLIRGQIARSRRLAIQDALVKLRARLSPFAEGRIGRCLLNAVSRQDSNAFDSYHKELRNIHGKLDASRKRAALLDRLRKMAPSWASAIENRRPGHGGGQPPGDALRAWCVRQLQEEISRREQWDPDSLQQECAQIRTELLAITRHYVKHLAWGRQHDRTNRRVQAALKGWLTTVSKRGFESGVLSARLKAEARHLLSESRAAVPVWIMPLSRVVESYDFRVAQFDVVIVDEASQCDMTGLVAMGLAQQAVVVGDDKQVSPVAVGEDLKQTQSLIDEYLQGVTNAHLYTGRHSVYDMATHGFAQTIRLTEHFRCVPDIIQFSNYLSYDGEIKPLRESSDIRTRPFVLAHRVADGLRRGRTNQSESEVIAALLIAASEQPEYAGMTFGVISMLGEEQAIQIDSVLQLHMSGTEYEARQVLCGIPPHFQGDERDVIFLSLVDSPTGGVQRSNANNDDVRKRYNVAASRAKNQMWIVHSLAPSRDLQPEDFRFRLIQHSLDPRATERQTAVAMERAESEFERLVIRDLSESGYRITPQWRVGALRIDIVVVGANGNRAAIECDGDRFHPHERLEHDLARQRILERRGWRFIRIRGTEFFKSRAQTMTRVKRRLHELGVEPIGALPDSSDRPADDELRQRIVRRAEELRQSWNEQENESGMPQNPHDSIEASVNPEAPEHVTLDTLDGQAGSPAELVMSCLREAGRPVGRGEVLERTGLDVSTWNETIRELLRSGLVSRQGDKRGARYWITDRMAEGSEMTVKNELA